MAEAVGHQPCKCKALSSNPSPTKKKKKKKKIITSGKKASGDGCQIIREIRMLISEHGGNKKTDMEQIELMLTWELSRIKVICQGKELERKELGQ
jgi:hypothetical protein